MPVQPAARGRNPFDTAGVERGAGLDPYPLAEHALVGSDEVCAPIYSGVMLSAPTRLPTTVGLQVRQAA